MIFAKSECETCQMVEPSLVRLASAMETIVLTQDDPTFPANLTAFDDTLLEKSFKHDIEAVPTLLRFKDGKEVARTQGWDRAQWRKITGISDLGGYLPKRRRGGGSRWVGAGST